MHKERLFNQILEGEDIVLWAGAGLSRYAGYPMGAQLVKILYEELIPIEKEVISAELSFFPENPDSKIPELPKFTSALERLHYGNSGRVYDTLKKVFLKDPENTDIHKKLATIPNFSNIITTNYDELFELTLKNYNTATDMAGVVSTRTGQQTLYKIHGDLRTLKNIIITGDDFVNFPRTSNPIFWEHIKHLMRTKTIVFMGYAVEDPNIRSIVIETSKELGKLAKQSYLISPGSKSEHLRFELYKQNIFPIEITAEAFATELVDFLDSKRNPTSIPKPHPTTGTASPKPLKKTPEIWFYPETKIYASKEVKEKLRRYDARHFFAIDDSILLAALNLNKQSESKKHQPDTLEVECKIPKGLIIKPTSKNPTTDELHLSVEPCVPTIKDYLINHASFKGTDTDENTKANDNKIYKKDEWKVGLEFIIPAVHNPEIVPLKIAVRPLSYLTTSLFNRCIVKGKAAVYNKVKHNHHKVIKLYKEQTKVFLENTYFHDFVFPSQLFIELAVVTSDEKVMLVRKRFGFFGTGVVAEVGRAWTCGPEFGLTFKHLHDNKTVLLDDAILEALENEFGVTNEFIKDWHIDGLCLALIHLNAALYGYCEIDMTGEELIECFEKNRNTQFDENIKPELIGLSEIDKELDKHERHDGKSWHPTAKIRLHSLLHLIKKKANGSKK